jgi:parvulin-like peptidyl-prolyl isomerase
MVLWGILILILPAFVLWGTSSSGRSKEKGPTYVGTISGKKVSFEDLSDNLLGVRCHLVLNYFNQPNTMDSILRNKAFLSKLAWDRIIMLKEAQKLKFKVSDNDVANYIRSHPIFLRNGRFDEGIYGYVLRNNIGLDARTFEEIVRENLQISRFSQSATKDITLSESDALADYKKENERFKISYALFPTADFLDKVKVDDVEARDYYEKHRKEFAIAGALPEKSILGFDGLKESIVAMLAEEKAKALALKSAEDAYGKIAGSKGGVGAAFENSVKKLGREMKDSALFSRTEYLEGVGETRTLADKASGMKIGEISGAVKVRKGAVIFKLLETQGIDEEKFAKEKDAYIKKAREMKKEAAMEAWLLKAEKAATLNIDLSDYTKYYRQ